MLALERVRRRASRLALVQKRGEMDYDDRLRKLKWPTLETLRLFLSLVECYKIVFDTNKLNFDDLFEFTLFLSESCGTGIGYQVLLLRLGAWVVLRMRCSAF